MIKVDTLDEKYNVRPAAPRPHVTFYLVWINRTSYQIVKTLALAGYRVTVVPEPTLVELTSSETNPSRAEREYFSWLFDDETIDVVADVNAIDSVDWLVFEVPNDRPRLPDRLRRLIAKARHVTAWNTTNHEHGPLRNLRTELATLVKFRAFLPRANRLIVSNGRAALRPTGLFRPASRQGYFVHPVFQRDARLRSAMFPADLDPGAPRPVRLIFSGVAQPESRRAVIDTVRRYLVGAGVKLLRHHFEITHTESMAGSPQVLWMIRDRNDDPQWQSRADVIPPDQWPSVLRLSDFSFCPPGDERKTHRVVESILQGTIPILDCPEEYDIGFEDGVNCIVVHRADWISAVSRALAMSEVGVRAMRAAACSLSAAHLQIDGCARDWLRRIGVTP